jgi:SAM-dependent methyltransferase
MTPHFLNGIIKYMSGKIKAGVLLDKLSSAINIFNKEMELLNNKIKTIGLNNGIQNQLTGAVVSLIDECKAIDNLPPGKLSPSELGQLKSAFRNSTFKWFMQSYCIRRSYDKPQGYAGDFAIIDSIYRNVPTGKNIGLALDKYYLENVGSRAMRSRESFIVESASSFIRSKLAVKKEHISLIDIGSGPGRDIKDIFDKTGPIKAILMDRDREALDYSEKILAPYKNSIIFKQVNLLRIMAGEKFNAGKFGTHDLIMCVGLYDYLDHDTSVRLTRSLYPMLKNGGTMIISNWDISNPSRTELEWVCDWNVYHRTEKDMRCILTDTKIPHKNINLTRDPSGHFHVVFISKS